ncbi:MAG: hypothetical protein E6G56_13255 [Actinobacteria bacterium]|nr:MAG: hypothetical protein E6G56_13255 [Actinomycetota bacterium]
MGRPRRWTNERIRSELAEFLAGRDTWPTAHEFRGAGLGALEQAARRYGGCKRWARTLGVKYQARERRTMGRPSPWTPERIHAELAELLVGRDVWPTVREFRRAGRGSLYAAMHGHGGVDAWAREFGMRARRRGDARYWTEERIRSELSEFLAEHRRLPPHSAFQAAGRDRLYHAARKRGLNWWAKELGTPRRMRKAHRPKDGAPA